jgi:ATP-dependent DNA helicase PIF1
LRRAPAAVSLQEKRSFDDAVHLFPTKEAVKAHNENKITGLNRQVITLNAEHTGTNAERADPDKACGLEAKLHVCVGAKVLLTSNLATHYGLVNGSSGTIKSIVYENDTAPPNLPKCILIEFDCYSGPAFLENCPKVVPVVPLTRSWSSGPVCSRTQYPIQLGWALTIHKSQGMTLEKAVVELGKKEFSIGISFVAISRVKKINTLLFKSSFDLVRLSKIKYSVRMTARLVEEQRLNSL